MAEKGGLLPGSISQHHIIIEYLYNLVAFILPPIMIVASMFKENTDTDVVLESNGY